MSRGLTETGISTREAVAKTLSIARMKSAKFGVFFFGMGL